MFVACVFCLLTPVLSAEPSLIAFNQETYDLYKQITGKRKVIFGNSELSIQCNKDSCCEHITGGLNIFLYGSVYLLAPECVVCLSVHLISN